MIRANKENGTVTNIT